MAKKIFYFDVETTGLDPKAQDFVQLAYVIEIDGEIKEQGNIFTQPFDYSTINQEALDVHNTTIEQLKGYQEPQEAYHQLIKVLGKYIDKFDKTDKFQMAGYNIHFDLDFLREFFIKNHDPYFGSWFNYKTIDPLVILYFLDGICKINLPNYKLETVCGYFAIDIKAHDALSDIKATRTLVKILTSKIEKGL